MSGQLGLHIVGMATLAFGLIACQSGSMTSPPPAAAPSVVQPAPAVSTVQLAPPLAPAVPPAPATVRYSIAGRTAPLWNIFVTADKGFFAAEGIDAQIQPMVIAVASPALVSGALDIASMPLDTIVLTQGAGDVVGIGSEIETPIFSLTGGKSVETPADVKNTVIAASSPTSGTTALLTKMLGALGLGPSEYQVLNTGGTPDRYAALQSGQVGAALLTQSFDIQAAAEGFKTLARSPDYVPDSQFTLFVARRPWLQENRDVAVRFLRAVMRGNRWLYDPANRGEAEAILQAEVGADPAMAAAIYDLYIRDVKIYRPDAEPQLSHLKGNIDLLVEVQALEPPGPNPEQYLDLGPLRDAQGSLAAR